MKISQDVMQVLDRAEVDGNRLVLTGQLDRKLYTDVNKVLEAIGGKWSRGAKAHVFDMPVVDVLDPILETGEYSRTKQDFGQFDSPPAVVARVIELAQIRPGMEVLEPSAGIGNIVRGIVGAGATPHAFEIDAKRRAALEASGLMIFPVAGGDFLTFDAAPTFDRVVMNPPFARQVDIDHVLHAAKFLKPGGRLVSVMSAGVLFRGNRKTIEFREFVADRHGEFERLPDASFAEAGTAIHTCIVSFNVP
jgi:protein-L-isoaspartate O-methyltransferase